MLPPELESIAETLRVSFRSYVAEDTSAEALPELLATTEMVTEWVRELGRGMLQDYADMRAQQAMERREVCWCGRRKEALKSKSWEHKTLLGVITIRDPYTYCRECFEGERPVQAWIGTDRVTWSLPAQEAAVDLATDESCEKAVEKLGRHHPGVEMGRTTALRLLHKHGAQARVFIDERLGAARASAVAQDVPPEGGVAELEVEFDGGMIPVATLEPIPLAEGEEPERTPVRGLPKRRKVCRWEEVKAGLVQVPGEDDRLYSLRPTTGLDGAFDDLFGLACMKEWTEGTQVRGIADGARYIRTRMEATFGAGDFRFILDRPHCREHLSAAGGALERTTGVPAQDWASAALATMEVGRADEVVSELQRAYLASGSDPESRNDTLRLEAGYFERNQDAVAYAAYRDAGWSTASSEIESCHGHAVQARMKIGGAWWHPDGVDNILALRMLKANGWWDDYWARERADWRQNAQRFLEARPKSAL